MQAAPSRSNALRTASSLLRVRRRGATMAALQASAASKTSALRLFPADSLFVSEPPPEWFGNPPNAADAAWTNKNWLKSRFHFNFAEHSGGRPNFGVLRVCNDDLVQPSRGFGTHPHRNAEIATYVVDGELTHKDSMGTSETLGRGAVQFMTAGRGVRHSERNDSASRPLHFIQMWFTPRSQELPPNYGSCCGDAAARARGWAHLVGDVADAQRAPPVKFNADANIFVTEVAPGAAGPTFELAAGRQAYLLAMEGSADVAGAHGSTTLREGDGAEVIGPNALQFTAGPQGAHLLLVEMASSMR